MNSITRDTLWTQLSEAGLTSGDLPAASASQSPWPVRAMLGFAGWLGAFFLLGFAGAAFAMIFRSAEAALPAGAVCCIAAFAVFRAMPRNDFVAQFGFAISLAGQALLLVGVAHLAANRVSSGTFLAMAAIEAGLAMAVPNYIHRVFTTIAANFCLFLAAAILGVPVLATAVASVGASLIWLHQVQSAARSGLWEPLGYGFAIALLHLDGALLIGPEFWAMLLPREAQAPHFLVWASPLAEGLVFVYSTWQLRKRAGVEPGSRSGLFILAAVCVVALCGLGAPGISAAILVIVLGFANGNRVLLGIGLLAFAAYLSHFYYQLSSTLLVKSMVLMATGAVLLGLRWVSHRYA